MPEVDLVAVWARVIARAGEVARRACGRISHRAQADGDDIGQAGEWRFEVRPAAVRLIGRW